MPDAKDWLEEIEERNRMGWALDVPRMIRVIRKYRKAAKAALYALEPMAWRAELVEEALEEK